MLRGNLGRSIVVGLVCLGATAGILAQASSASYVLQQSTTNAGGAVASSASYVATSSTGQATTIGASSSANSRFVLQAGFWAYLGPGLVPVVLSVSRDEVTPGNLDLSWSGNNAPYTIFRSTQCGDVFSSTFATTSTNELGNIPPLPAALECFNVLATAPGPTPPPG